MSESARGMSKMICDLLNINKGESYSGDTSTLDGTENKTNGVESQGGGERDVAESISETASTTSSLSPIRPVKEPMSDVSTSDSEGIASRMSLEPIKQVIQMSGNDSDGSISVYGNDVEIVASEAAFSSTATASNKIKFNSMVNYDWELRNYRGYLIAVSSKCIAYALRGRTGYVVRLLNPETASRTLIKGFVGMISELAFSHKDSDTLACVDEGGNVYVWIISEQDGNLEYSVKLHIKRSISAFSEHHRLVWTPYMPDPEDDGSSGAEGRPLAVTHNNQVEVMDIDTIADWCGRTEVSIVEIRQGIEGYVEITDGHTKPITEGALSPDGTVLATASEDGFIKFWQLSETVECMHEFQPHDGAPLACMLFTDNQTSQDKELPMWRFLITGAEFNREIKVWCTVTWSCLQTIRFTSPDITSPGSLRDSFLKVCLDLSASYLVISDIKKKVLYVLMFHQDFEEGQAHVTSVAEFLLTQPLLSFTVGQVKLFKLKLHGEQNSEENGENNMDDDIHSSHTELEEVTQGEKKGKKFGVQLQLFCIQRKAMQELLVHFQPEPSVPPPTPSTLSSLTTIAGQSVVHDALSDLSGMETGTEASTDLEEPDETTDAPLPVRAKLITPDAFTHSALKNVSRLVTTTSGSSSSSVTTVSGLNNSQVSFDELLGSSVSSRLSDTTIKSGSSATPQGSFTQESGMLTPTSLPLPASPTVPSVPDPSTVPIPNFQSTPQLSSSLDQCNQPLPQGSEPLVSVLMNETEASPCNIAPWKSHVPAEKGEAASEEREIEVLVDDEAKEEGPEELPESQKPEAEIQEELETLERKSSSGSSVSESLRPVSSHAERNLISLVDNDNFKAVTAHTDGEAVIDHMEEPWGMNFDEEVVPTGRESPESTHALPVSSPAEATRKQQHFQISLASAPQTAVDIPPEPVQVTMDASILSSLGELLSLVKSQQREITELHHKLMQQQADQQQKITAVLHEVKLVEERVSNRVGISLGEFSREESQRLDKALRDKHSADKKKHEQLQNNLSQTLTTTLSGKLDKAIKAEVKSAVVPTVQKVLNSLQEQVNTTMAQKLSAADAVLKESIVKMVKSKGVVDTIGTAAASALQGPIQVTYREAFQNSILPSFERACQNMFQQINDSFNKGTQQYLHQVTTALDNRRREEKDLQEPLLKQLQAQTQSLQAMLDRLSTNLKTDLEVMLQKQLASSVGNLREEVFSKLMSETLAAVQSAVRTGVDELREQLSAVATSTAMNSSLHPPDTEQTQMIVSRLLNKGEVGQAFQEALTAADLNVVMYVCESVDPAELFSQSPCPLSQPVLLSLIQQLSVDLTVNTELKHKYIEESLMALDTKDEVTSEHMPSVIEGLCQQLQGAMQEASGPTQRSLRMLHMAARSLLRY